MLQCHFCEKECKNNNSKAQHELYCGNNPNKRYKVPSYGMLGKKGQGSNQWLKAKETGVEYEISEETRSKLSLASSKQVWTEERRQEHRKIMAKAVEDNPESYTSSNRGRTKQIIYDNIKFQGKWELDFYKWCKYNDIQCERNTQGFKYEWNGNRTYYPDFYLPESDTYVEVKGYKTERDLAKWNQFPKRLKVVDKEGINKVRKNESPL